MAFTDTKIVYTLTVRIPFRSSKSGLTGSDGPEFLTTMLGYLTVYTQVTPSGKIIKVRYVADTLYTMYCGYGLRNSILENSSHFRLMVCGSTIIGMIF